MSATGNCGAMRRPSEHRAAAAAARLRPAPPGRHRAAGWPTPAWPPAWRWSAPMSGCPSCWSRPFRSSCWPGCASASRPWPWRTGCAGATAMRRCRRTTASCCSGRASSATSCSRSACSSASCSLRQWPPAWSWRPSRRRWRCCRASSWASASAAACWRPSAARRWASCCWRWPRTAAARRPRRPRIGATCCCWARCCARPATWSSASGSPARCRRGASAR